jgi:peptidoglycan/LPS O-acetylase OafA/YrhL
MQERTQRQDLARAQNPTLKQARQAVPTQPTTDKRRSADLDVIRAALCWVVVGVHCAWFGGTHSPAWHKAGVWCVNGFILLSGYVITLLLLRKKESYRKFIFRRAMRLYPVYAVCLAATLLLQLLTIGRIPQNAIIDANSEHYFWPSLLLHLSLLHGLEIAPSIQHTFLPPAWSISLEWQLYLIAPLLSFAALKWRMRFLVPALLLSAGLAYLHLRGLMSLGDAFFPSHLFYFSLGLAAALKWPALPALVRWPSFVVDLGLASYSTYLCHWPILALLSLSLPLQLSPPERTVFLFILGSPLIALTSFLLYETVEMPGIKLGARIISYKQKARCA